MSAEHAKRSPTTPGGGLILTAPHECVRPVSLGAEYVARSVCFGRRFAMLEMLVTMALLLRRYQFTLDPTHKVTDVSHITLAPKTGIKLFVSQRDTA